MRDADYYLERLKLEPHPEGGYYRESYRSSGIIPGGTLKDFNGERNFATMIYFLLRRGQKNSLHRIKSDEIWTYCDGGRLELFITDRAGREQRIVLGADVDDSCARHFTVPAGLWFSASVISGDYALFNCFVAPGFAFEDLEFVS